MEPYQSLVRGTIEYGLNPRQLEIQYNLLTEGENPFGFSAWFCDWITEDWSPTDLVGFCRLLTKDIEFHLDNHYDYIFDNQKDKALKKFWNSGLKAVPRANPG